MCYEVIQYCLLLNSVLFVCFSSPSAEGWPVVLDVCGMGVGVIGTPCCVDDFTNEAEYTCKSHRCSQDGVGDCKC